MVAGRSPLVGNVKLFVGTLFALIVYVLMLPTLYDYTVTNNLGGMEGLVVQFLPWVGLLVLLYSFMTSFKRAPTTTVRRRRGPRR